MGFCCVNRRNIHRDRVHELHVLYQSHEKVVANQRPGNPLVKLHLSNLFEYDLDLRSRAHPEIHDLHNSVIDLYLEVKLVCGP
jgi:hypothetical protein